MIPSTNGHGPKRAIPYARVSTDDQAKSGFSLAQQLEALRAYATQEGYEVLEEVQDPGQSGASLERPGVDHIRDLVAEGGVSVMLAQDRDRFAREPLREFGVETWAQALLKFVLSDSRVSCAIPRYEQPRAHARERPRGRAAVVRRGRAKVRLRTAGPEVRGDGEEARA